MNQGESFGRQTTVRLFGREFPVLDRVVVENRSYLLLDRLSSGQRERYLGLGSSSMQSRLPVAIMILPGAIDCQHLRALQRLTDSNSHLPAILGCERRGDRTLVVQKWIRGTPLSEYLTRMREGRLPRISPPLAWQRIRGLAHGLRWLHNLRQIVHGDIKPDNIIVSRDPGRFYLIDYGSAWGIERTATRDSGDGISPVYAAPELQNGARGVSIRCDQFSLSVILYQLLTMQVPYANFGGQAGRPEFVAQMRTSLRMPSELAAGDFPITRSIWQGIDEVVSKGLSLDPAGRFPTPELWLRALDEVDYSMRRPTTLSPTQERLTRVVRWVANRLGWQ